MFKREFFKKNVDENRHGKGKSAENHFENIENHIKNYEKLKPLKRTKFTILG